MSQWNIAAKPKDEQDKVNVDLAFSGVACRMRISEALDARKTTVGIF